MWGNTCGRGKCEGGVEDVRGGKGRKLKGRRGKVREVR